MLKLYRFLNPEGDGLYQGDFWKKLDLPYYGDEIGCHQPTVWEDVREWPWAEMSKVRCAFLDPTQIVSWFRYDSPLNIFIHGGSLVELTVDPTWVKRGKAQCIYYVKAVKETRVVELDEFIDLIDKPMKKFERFLTW